MLPLVLVVILGVLELGALRVAAARARSAADLATVVAIGDQDLLALSATGRFRPSQDAAAVAREYLVLNLLPVEHTLGAGAAAIAGAADVAVFADAGQTDPLTGRRYEQPAVRISADVPIKTPAFAALLLGAVTTIRVDAASEAR